MIRGEPNERQETTDLRLRAAAAEGALAEAELLILDLNKQLDSANRASVRMAQRICRTRARAAA